MSLPFGPSNVTCLLAVSTATILPWTVRTVSAAIPPSGAALGGAAVSAGMLAGGGLCVLPHPAATIASAANNENWSIARFFMSSFPRARVFPRLFVCRKPRNQNRQQCLSPEPLALLVTLTKWKGSRTASSTACHPHEASHASLLLSRRSERRVIACHPDEASIASGWKDLGQRGASAAGSGSEFCIRLRMDRCAISKTGTGFADAKLSEILPSARVARSVRMTQKAGGGCLSSIRHAAILGP